MNLDQQIKISNRSGWLRWSARGYWSIHIEGFTDRESLEEKFLHPRSDEYDTDAIDAAKERLLARARARFKKNK